jgi:hypothetical protein
MATDFSFLDGGKVVAGDQGDGVLIEQVLVKTGEKKGEEEAFIELMGTAKTYLKDGYNPSAGFNPLPEEFVVTDRVKVVVAGKEADNKILYDRLNKELHLDPPLVDREDEWERFLQGTKNSIYDKLVGARLYFGARKGNGVGDQYTHYFYNILPVTKREEATPEKGGAKIKDVLKRKKEKAAASGESSGDLYS